MRYEHLRALGITPWVRRTQPGQQVADPRPDALPDRLPDPPFCLRLNQPQAAIGTIILEWPQGQLILGDEHPGGQLLLGILAAMQQDCDNFQVLQLDFDQPLPRPDELPLAGSVVLCFVENWQVEQGQHQGRLWARLPTLSQMLSQRQFKAQAWQQLKPLAEKLQ